MKVEEPVVSMSKLTEIWVICGMLLKGDGRGIFGGMFIRIVKQTMGDI